jgi:hypothetical protein
MLNSAAYCSPLHYSTLNALLNQACEPQSGANKRLTERNNHTGSANCICIADERGGLHTGPTVNWVCWS